VKTRKREEIVSEGFGTCEEKMCWKDVESKDVKSK